MFKLFWPLTQLNSPVLSIPNYNTGKQEDSIDLQIKSLMYMFKRCKIAKLGPFLNITESGEYKLAYIDEEGREEDHDDKLDIIYNKTQFEAQLVKDEHRILIDYVKNKFRAMLILSDQPRELKSVPELSYDISFKFSVLKPDSSNEEYIQVLLNESNFYIEHNVSDDLKIELLTSILYDQRAIKRKFDKDDRAHVISSYLRQLAFHIQVDRIYKATLKSKERIPAPEQPELRPKQSPARQVQAKQSFIKSQPTENSYVTKPVPLFLTSPNVKYQSPSRRQQGSPLLEKSPVLKASSGTKVTIFDDSMDEKLVTPQTSPQSTPQRTLRASPSRMKLRTSDHVVMQPPAAVPAALPVPAPAGSSRATSPQRSLAKKASQSILKMDTKFQDLQGKGALQSIAAGKRRNSTNSSSASDFSDSGSHGTSLTNLSLDQGNVLSELDREALYDQSKNAVRIRIERERSILADTH